MKNYTQPEQKKILQIMESDILVLIVIDTATDEFEVIYSDGGYRDYNSRGRQTRLIADPAAAAARQI